MEHFQIIKFVSDSVEAAKAGKAIESYKSVFEIFTKEGLPPQSHYAFGWIIYYAINQSADYDIENRKWMLVTYLKLKTPHPHKLHSMILTQAIRLYKDAANAAFGKRRNDVSLFSIIGFLKLWDVRNLRPGDWKRKEVNGKTISSTAEKMITVLTDELENSQLVPQQEFVEVAMRGLTAFPDSYNLYAQNAVLRSLTGENELAIDLMRKALLLAPGKFHLWSKMANLIEVKEDMNLYVALQYKALKSHGPEQFKGRIRLALTRCLAKRKMFAQMQWELKRVKSIYESNGWHLPSEYTSLSRILPTGVTPSDPEPIYQRVAHLADDFIYASLPSTKMKKTYHKNCEPGRLSKYGKVSEIAWRLTDEKDRNIWFNPGRFGINPDKPMGTWVSVKIFNGKIVRATINEE